MLASSLASEPQFSTQFSKYIAKCRGRADDGTTKTEAKHFFHAEIQRPGFRVTRRNSEFQLKPRPIDSLVASSYPGWYKLC